MTVHETIQCASFLFKPSKTVHCSISSARRLDKPMGWLSLWFLMAQFMLHMVKKLGSVS